MPSSNFKFKDRNLQLKIKRRVSEILLNEWDPIGVKGNPIAINEYDQYALKIVGMLFRETSEREISDYLNMILVNEFNLNQECADSKLVAEKLVIFFKSVEIENK